MKQNKIAKIKYTRSTDSGGVKGEVTERVIIPTFIPQQNVRAIDVTDLTEDEQTELANKWEQYQEYYKLAAKTLFDFETWAQHETTTETQSPSTLKWRTFKLSNLEEVE